MNFLAHLFLSRNKPAEMVGNFIGDHVKGSDYKNYPTPIAAGILLHRAIDDYTDHHPIVKETVQLLRPVYGRFAGVISDMLYDHYLAKNFSNYSTQSLQHFEADCYEILFDHYSYLPDRVKNFLPKMKAAQRLQSYAELKGIFESLEIMSRHTRLPNRVDALKMSLPNIGQNIEKQFVEFFSPTLNNIDFLRIKAAEKLAENPPKTADN